MLKNELLKIVYDWEFKNYELGETILNYLDKLNDNDIVNENEIINDIYDWYNVDYNSIRYEWEKIFIEWKNKYIK